MKPKFLSRPISCRPLALVSLCLLCLGAPVMAVTTGTWNVDAVTGLTWTTAASWTGGIPNGVGDVANFTNNITAARSIALGGDKTVGALNIGDSATAFVAFTISSGTPLGSQLIFDQTGIADATLTVPNIGGVAANNLSATGILLKDNLVIRTDFPNSSVTQLSVNSSITDGAGSFGITKEGAGIIQLGGANSFKGGTTVNGGRINVNSSITALGSGATTIANGGQVLLNTSAYNNFSITGNGYTNSADTLAALGAIRFANNRGVMRDLTVASAARIGVDTTASGFISGNLAGSGNLELNGSTGTTTTGSITLLGGGSGYTGTLSIPKGSFSFASTFGGSISAAPVASAVTFLGTGTSLAGNLSLDSTNAAATVRNNHGTLAITGNLALTGSSTILPSSFPAPGTGSLTLMTYAAKTGAGTLTFAGTGYRGTPSLSIGATSASISGLDLQTRTWNATTGTWAANTAGSWTEGDAKFCNGDAVVFGNVGSGTITATLTGTATPSSITFNNTSTHDYVLTGGVIDGAGAIVKNGTGNVTLGGTNTLTGSVSVNAGRLTMGTVDALGFTSGVTVASGAAFDLNGKSLTRPVDITVGGTGDGGVPALTSTTSVTFTGAPTSNVRNLTLTADTTIGGPGNFDVGGSGVIDGGGFTLTKTGSGTVYLIGISKNIKTVAAAGTLLGYYGSNPFGSSLLIKSGATAGSASSGTYTTDVTIESGGIFQQGTGSEGIWTGTFTALGDATLGNNTGGTSDCTIVQGFAIPGNLTKSGSSALTLLGTVNVSGSTSVTTGTLYLGNGGTGGSLGTTTPISISGSLGSLTILRSDDVALPNNVTIASGCNLTNSGPNTLTLSGTIANSGTIGASSGTVRVTGDITGTGTISVSAGATLEGTSSTTSSVAVAAGAPGGTVSPGVPGSAIGTLRTGNLTFASTATTNGTYVAQINTNTGTSDKIVVTGNVNLGTSTTPGAGAALVVTNLGTAAPLDGSKFTLISYTGTLNNTFAGLPEGSTITISGIPYTIMYADTVIGSGVKNVTLTPPVTTPYGTWISSHFISADPAVIGLKADPDNDGVPNLLEYITNTDPAQQFDVNAPTFERTGGNLVVTFYRSKAAFTAGYTAKVEYSQDLTTWTPATAGMIDPPYDVGDSEIIVTTVPIPSGATRFFSRLRMTGP